MEDIREAAREIVSGLKETLVADTVDFMVNTSLQILPLAYRNDDNKALLNKIGFRRILRFNMLMKRIVYLFMHDDEESLELYEKMLISVLGKNEEAAVTKFKQLMQGWKSDKADSVATLIDHEESAIKGLKSLEISEKEVLTTQPSFGSQNMQKANSIGKTLANTLIKTTTTSDRAPADMPSENENTELPSPSVNHQKPCESNAYGVETGDGVLVGHPPPYPPALLDWESPEDNEEFEELVSNRQARIRTQAPTNNGGSQAGSHEEKKGHNSDSDDGWICL